MEDSVHNGVGWDREYASSSILNTNVYGASGYEYGSVSGMSTETGVTRLASVNEVYLCILITKCSIINHNYLKIHFTDLCCCHASV